MSEEAVPLTTSQVLFDQQRSEGLPCEASEERSREVIAFALAFFEQQQNDTPSKPGEYVLMCEFCLKRFLATNKNSGLQRTSYEYETLRRVLAISDHNRLPVVCDPCYETMTVPPEQHTMGFPNPVLMQVMNAAS